MSRFLPLLFLALAVPPSHSKALPRFSGAPILGNFPPATQQIDLSPVPGKPQPSSELKFHAKLDSNYELHWAYNDTHIIFEVIVKTNGYVGFGISPNGRMYPADVIIAWVDNGVAHFSDRHAEGHYQPAKDTHQDWYLLSASETGEYTQVKMVRLLDTCDPQDRPVLDGTTRVIYSYHQDDPASESSIMYHGGSQRGTKSLLLLDPPTEDQQQVNLPADTFSMDFLNQNYSVPGTDTTYHCTVFKMPDLGGKRHLIRYEPVIQKGHEKLVHHIIIYYCSGHLSDSTVGSQFSCQSNHLGGQCENVFVAWAIGGRGFNFPPHAGFSLGTSDDPVYVKMETHYDNPRMRSDFVDNSGMRLFVTSEIRQHDASVLYTGVSVNHYQIIPPFDPGFLSSGYCHESCLAEALGDQEIHVFSNLLHAHLAGVKLRTRHFRNGVELPPIGEDNSYDFDFQEQRLLKEERTIKKGDSVTTECVYDTTKRTGITYGGLSSREEMCLSFMVYYPRIKLSTCLTKIQYKIPHQFAGQSVFDIVKDLDWTQSSVRDAFRKDIEESRVRHACYGPTQAYSLHGQYTPMPSYTQEFHKNQTCPTH